MNALRRWGLPLVLLATLVACLPALRNGYAQDARFLVMVDGDAAQNPMVASLQPLGAYFTSHYWKGAAPSAHLYRPCTVLSFALVRHGLGVPLGNDALLQHLVDVLLHVLATALVFRLLRVLRVDVVAALVATLVFGLHALHAEAIASIVGRAELLAFTGGLAGSLLALAATDAVTRRACVLRAVAAAACFFVAFGAKESALPWLAFAPLLAWVRARRSAPAAEAARPAPWRGALLAAACALPVALAYLWLRARVLATLTEPPAVEIAVSPLYAVDAMTRVATGAVVWVHGLAKLVWPFWLASDYGGQTFGRYASLLEPAAAIAAALLLLVLVLTLYAARRQPLAFAAGACFLGFTLPISNVPFAIGTVFAERLYYTPSLALPLVLAALAPAIASRPRVRNPLVIAAAIWLVASAWTLAGRLAEWRDDATLLACDVARNPRSARLRSSASEIERNRGNLAAATAHARAAVALEPRYAGAWSNLGALLLAAGDVPEAEQAVRSGLACEHQNTMSLALLRVNLARVLLAQGRPGDAVPELEHALRLAPVLLPAWAFLLDALETLRRDERIAELVAAGERVAPGQPLWPLHRGLLALRRGDPAAAERSLRAAIAGGLDDERTRAALREALARQRRR